MTKFVAIWTRERRAGTLSLLFSACPFSSKFNREFNLTVLSQWIDTPANDDSFKGYLALPAQSWDFASVASWRICRQRKVRSILRSLTMAMVYKRNSIRPTTSKCRFNSTTANSTPTFRRRPSMPSSNASPPGTHRCSPTRTRTMALIVRIVPHRIRRQRHLQTAAR
jgi:hypothetical protein